MEGGSAIGILMFLLFWLGFLFIIGLMWWKIMAKTGYHGALGILMMVPVANIIMMGVLAFKEWPVQAEHKGAKAQSSGLPAPAIVVIVVVAMVPVLALLAAIAIPNFLRARLTANEAYAQASVKTIATAIETYRASNNGQYPISEYDLVSGNYLSDSFDKETKNGYTYSVGLDRDNYEITATPQACGSTGTRVFMVSKDGNISEKKCY